MTTLEIRVADQRIDETALPDFPLQPNGPVGRAFLNRNLDTFRSAARYVRNVPYGRNKDRSDYRLVLSEGRGTCSTKHALLAALAEEHAAPVHLVMGIYLMCEANTPGVGIALRHHGLEAVPEAHCYLVYEKWRIDLTQPDLPSSPISDFLHQEALVPADIGAHKVKVHRRFLEEWARKMGYDIDAVWTAREACIEALSNLTR